MNDSLPVYHKIYLDYRRKIEDGTLQPGQKLPTEHEIAKLYLVSRPTVTKALARLHDEQFVYRKAGSGTFVSQVKIVHSETKNRYFGLLIPKLGVTEIFEPICARIAQLSEAYDFHLLWGDSSAHGTDSIARNLESTLDRYIKKQVEGIFFVPLELIPNKDEINHRLIGKIKEAKLPLVLIDSDIVPFGKRSSFDLVGIDNVRAGYRAADHLLSQGVQRIDYLFRQDSANTVEHRLKGIRLALIDHGIFPQEEWIHSADPQNKERIQQIIQSGARNIICANDSTALDLLHVLYEQGFSVPQDVRVIGFDDVKFASYSRVPMTTFKQPCILLGDLAVQTMENRCRNPHLPPITALAEPEFVIRESSIIPQNN